MFLYRGENTKRARKELFPIRLEEIDIKKYSLNFDKGVWMFMDYRLALWFSIFGERNDFVIYNKEIRYLHKDSEKQFSDGVIYRISLLPLKLKNSLICTSNIAGYKEYISSSTVKYESYELTKPELAIKEIMNSGFTIRKVDKL